MRRIFAFLLFLILLGWAGYGVAASYTPPRTFFVATASVTATGSSTSAQSLIGTGISQDGTTSPTLPANFFSVAGSGLDIFASGYYSSGTITTQTATFAVKLGSTTLLASSAVTPISGVTSGAWMMHCKVTAYTVGSSGTLQANCGVTLTGSTLTPADVPLVNTSTVSLNTTTTQAVTTTITWGGSPTSSQTITATNFVLSYIDAPMAYTGGSVTPASYSGLQVWYSADCINGGACGSQPTNGTALTGSSCWYDRSGNANNLACTNGPVFNTGQLNSLPGVTFTSASSMRVNTTTDITWGTSQTAFFVFKVVSGGSTYAGIFGSDTNAGALSYIIQTGVTQQLTIENGAGPVGGGVSTVTTGTFYQSDYSYNSSTGAYSLRLAEAADASGTNALSVTGAQTSLGEDNNNNYFNGVLCEAFVYSPALTLTQIQALETTYLHTKYGI